jgi:hypothetical protein
MKITQTHEFTETLSQRSIFCKMFFDGDRAAALLFWPHFRTIRPVIRSVHGIFGLKTPSPLMTVKFYLLFFSASISLQSPHAFAIMSAIRNKHVHTDGIEAPCG